MPGQTYGNRWKAKIKRDGWWACLGTFDTHRRAELSEELAKHWYKTGTSIFDIPRAPHTKEAL